MVWEIKKYFPNFVTLLALIRLLLTATFYSYNEVAKTVCGTHCGEVGSIGGILRRTNLKIKLLKRRLARYTEGIGPKWE